MGFTGVWWCFKKCVLKSYLCLCHIYFKTTKFIMNKKYLAYGLLALGAVAAGWYVWGLSTIDSRVKVTNIRIADVGLRWIRLAITVTNYTTVSVPFTGFSGTVIAQGYTLSNVELRPSAAQRSIPKGESIEYIVEAPLNWAQFAALVPNIVNLISTGKWKEVITSIQPYLKGTIYAENFEAEINMPLV